MGGQKRMPGCLQHAYLLQKTTGPRHRLSVPFTLLPDTASFSSVHGLQLISLALQQSTAEPPFGTKFSEVGPSPLRREADLQCRCWPGLPSFSESSSQLDACPLLARPFFPCSVPGRTCRLCGAAGWVTGLNSLFRRG